MLLNIARDPLNFRTPLPKSIPLLFPQMFHVQKGLKQVLWGTGRCL